MIVQICWESFKELVLSKECPIEGAGCFFQRWIGIPVSIIKVCTYKCTDRCLVSNNDTFHLPLSYDLYMCISNISKKLPNSIIWHRCYTLLQLVYNGLLIRKVRSACSLTMNILGQFNSMLGKIPRTGGMLNSWHPGSKVPWNSFLGLRISSCNNRAAFTRMMTICIVLFLHWKSNPMICCQVLHTFWIRFCSNMVSLPSSW